MPIGTIDNGDSGSSARTKINAALTAVDGLGDAATKNVGASAGNVAAGDDSRFSDARTPTAHASSHTSGVDDIQDATASQKGLATATQITKLDGIEALADVTDAGNVGSSIGGATAITTIGDTDQIPVVQSNVLKSIAYSALKTLLSALYQAKATILSTFSSLSNASGVLTNDGAGNLSWQTPGGGGDVVGPASATDNAIARFDTTTGKLIQNSGITVADGATGTLSGTNTGDQTIALTGDVTGSGTGSFAATLATVNSNVGSFGSATASAAVTVNAKGLVTAASASTITPAVGSITGLGTGVATALAVNVGSAGAPVVNGGALGTPSGGMLTNCVGLPVAGLASFVGLPVEYSVALGTENDAAITGLALTWRVPAAMTVSSVNFECTTAPTGSVAILDLKEGGVSIFSTKPQIAISATTSVGGAVPGVVSDAGLAYNAVLTFSLDQIGSTVAGTGYKATILGVRA